MTEEKKTILEESFDEIKSSPLYQWFDRTLDSSYGLFALCIFVFFDAFLLVIPMELLLAGYAAKKRDISVTFLTLLVTASSFLGYACLYWFGTLTRMGTETYLSNVFGPETLTEIGGLVEKSVGYFGFTSALASIPVPLSPFSFGAGVFAAPFLVFAAAFMAGRLIRYGVSAWVGRKYGEAMLGAVLKNVALAAFVLMALSIFMLYRMFL